MTHGRAIVVPVLSAWQTLALASASQGPTK